MAKKRKMTPSEKKKKQNRYAKNRRARLKASVPVDSDPLDLLNHPERSEVIEETFDGRSSTLMLDLLKALDIEAHNHGNMPPMARVAKLFYNDDRAALKILKHMIPELQSTKVDVSNERPFQILVDLSDHEEYVAEPEDSKLALSENDVDIIED